MLGRSSPGCRRTSGHDPRRLALMLALVVALFVAKDAASILLYPARTQVQCRADTLLVMGAAQYNGVPSPAFARRLDWALELYQAGCAERIVVTGGKRPADAYTEGDAGTRYLLARGVPASALHSETRSATSFENLAYAAPLIPDRRVTVVTDDLHAYRTRWLAQRLGYAAELAPVPTRAERWPYWSRELVILGAYHLGIVR